MSHPPPVPPANRSSKGPGKAAPPDESLARGNSARPGKAPGNLGEQSRQGNIKQNTTHPGYQQDR